MKFISAENAKLQLAEGRCVILDVREAYEQQICSITSLQIPMAEVSKRVTELPTDVLIVVMCKTGKRAEAVANLLLTEFEISNICVLEGGIFAWIDTNEPHLEKY